MNLEDLNKKHLHGVASDSSEWSYYVKDKKVGEGTYAVVYQGWAIGKDSEPAPGDSTVRGRAAKSNTIDTFPPNFSTRNLTACVKYMFPEPPARRKIAIKKIKIGQFKDGLDMSAIREVKFLQELRHPNIIEVSISFQQRETWAPYLSELLCIWFSQSRSSCSLNSLAFSSLIFSRTKQT